jgi:hypothetical protein
MEIISISDSDPIVARAISGSCITIPSSSSTSSSSSELHLLSEVPLSLLYFTVYSIAVCQGRAI